MCNCLCLCACMCVYIFMKSHITAQSDPVILVILCHSRIGPPKGGSTTIITKTSDQTRQRGHTLCACVYVCVCVFVYVRASALTAVQQ